jgi:hypothetical protein
MALETRHPFSPQAVYLFRMCTKMARPGEGGVSADATLRAQCDVFATVAALIPWLLGIDGEAA